MSGITSKFPYERIVQWTAGPISIVAGYLGTQLTTHIGIFGSLGISKDQTARAIVTVGTFGVGALVTYAAHHKWLGNLPKWWDTIGSEALTLAEGADASPDVERVLAAKPETAVKPDPPAGVKETKVISGTPKPITDNPQA
jgi:hypothetical protein